MRDVRVDKLKSAISRDIDFGEHSWESIQQDDTFKSQNEQVGEEGDNQASEEKNEAANRVDGNIPVFEFRCRKKKLPDTSAEQRKRQVLCQRKLERLGGINEDMKSFIQEIFNVSFSILAEKLEKKIDDRLGKIVSDYSKFKNYVSDLIKSLVPIFSHQHPLNIFQ